MDHYPRQSHPYNYLDEGTLQPIKDEVIHYLDERPDLREVAKSTNFIEQFGRSAEDIYSSPNIPYEHNDYSYLNPSNDEYVDDNQYNTTKKDYKSRSGDDKKGLRVFSRRVCEKLKERGETTYKAVASDLIFESQINQEEVEERNVRRRVYDAINVLIAMNIIEKKPDKKIKWIGLPSKDANSDLLKEKEIIEHRISQKRELLDELKLKHSLYSSLIERNKQKSKDNNQNEENTQKITLPFILIHTNTTGDVNCTFQDDLTKYIFRFSQPFTLSDDSDILNMMPLGRNKRSATSSPNAHTPKKRFIT